MIELRWLHTKQIHTRFYVGGIQESEEITIPVLQFRESIGENGDIVVLWTEWKDVPVVEE